MTVTVGPLLGAAGRFARVGRLPVDFRWRCRLGAAAGTARGIYGAACGAPPVRELEMLRRAARVAVCNGGFRAAAEVVFRFLFDRFVFSTEGLFGYLVNVR